MLFSCIATGDEFAVTEFYLRYVKKLYPRISRMLDAAGWAEEIIQDVFTKLWKVRHTLNEAENPQAYLYRMAGNRTLDFLKQRSTEVKLRYQAARMYDTPGINQTGQWFDFKQAEQLYREAVENLPEKRRIIFLLKHEGGLSYEEIATRLTLSTHTVRYTGRNYSTSDTTIFADYDAMDFSLKKDAPVFRSLPGFNLFLLTRSE